MGQLWLRRTSESSSNWKVGGLHVEVSLGKMLKHKLLPMAVQSVCVRVCVYVLGAIDPRWFIAPDEQAGTMHVSLSHQCVNRFEEMIEEQHDILFLHWYHSVRMCNIPVFILGFCQSYAMASRINVFTIQWSTDIGWLTATGNCFHTTG